MMTKRTFQLCRKEDISTLGLQPMLGVQKSNDSPTKDLVAAHPRGQG